MFACCLKTILSKKHIIWLCSVFFVKTMYWYVQLVSHLHLAHQLLFFIKLGFCVPFSTWLGNKIPFTACFSFEFDPSTSDPIKLHFVLLAQLCYHFQLISQKRLFHHHYFHRFHRFHHNLHFCPLFEGFFFCK